MKGTSPDGAVAVYRFLEIVDQLGHLDPDLCPRRVPLGALLDFMLQGVDGSSIPEVLLAPFLIGVLKLGFGTVGVTIELQEASTGRYDRCETRRNRVGGPMAYPLISPQKWERADKDRFIDYTVKVYDHGSNRLADRIDIELQSYKHHGSLFRVKRFSEIGAWEYHALPERDARRFRALLALSPPVDPLLVLCGAVNDDPLAVAAGLIADLAHSCSDRWTAAIDRREAQTKISEASKGADEGPARAARD